MPSEHESPEQARRLRSRPSPGPRTQQRKQHDSGEQKVSDRMRAAMDVASRGQNMHRESHQQEAGRSDMHGLEVPVSRPELPASCSSGRHGEKQQGEQRQDPGVLVARGGRLEVLDDAVIGAERQSDVESRRSERYPAEELVTAQPQGLDGTGPRPHREHAENEAARDRAEAQGLCDLPRYGGRCHDPGRVIPAYRSCGRARPSDAYCLPG